MREIRSLNYIENEPIQLFDQLFEQKEVQVWLVPEYKNHPTVSGNKWWKLKHNLREAQNQQKTRILTFGGAYSNHIRATAAAAKELGFSSIGIIRGEETLPLNDTLTFARDNGMELHYVSRSDYRKKEEANFISSLQQQFGDFFLIPEGGTNQLAVQGCAEWGKQLLAHHDFDCVTLPVGTGGTMTGLVCGLAGKKKVIGISVLKGGDFLNESVATLIKQHSGRTLPHWEIKTDYHFGGYAKTTKELDDYIKMFQQQHRIPLDHVYAGKHLYAVTDFIRQNYFKPGTKLLVVHTGGVGLE